LEGFIIRDELQWQYAQGLPKSLDVGKAFLRREGAVSTLSQKWRGWGTGLKPAHEPILLCQKPLDGTYCANVGRWGCGALNVDACRIPFESAAEREAAHRKNDHERYGSGPRGNHVYRPDPSVRLSYRAPARFPSNVVRSDPLGDGYDRYFVIPKASRTERNRGLGQLPEEPGQQRYGSLTGGDFAFVGPDGKARTRRGSRPQHNVHPTVKPIALMEHLLKLVVPPGGRVLDPFAGSGSTLIAAAALGLDAVGIEREPRYVEIATSRLRAIGVRATPEGPGGIQ
jgi:site-specific DNA-methyltransferase (adenine-specific)